MYFISLPSALNSHGGSYYCGASLTWTWGTYCKYDWEMTTVLYVVRVNRATGHATRIPRRYKGTWLLDFIGGEFWFDFCLFHSLTYNDLHGLLTDSLIWSWQERLIRRCCSLSLTCLHVGNLLQIWLGNASSPRRYKRTCLLDVIDGEFWSDFCLFHCLTYWFTPVSNNGAATLWFLVHGLSEATYTTTNQPIS